MIMADIGGRLGVWDESEQWSAFQEYLFVHMETQELFRSFLSKPFHFHVLVSSFRKESELLL